MPVCGVNGVDSNDLNCFSVADYGKSVKVYRVSRANLKKLSQSQVLLRRIHRPATHRSSSTKTNHTAFLLSLI